MSVTSVEQQLQSCASVAAKEAWVRAQTGVATKGKISRDDLDRLHGLLKDNRRPQALALGLAVALVGGANTLVFDLRRRGFLRASRYGFRVGAVREFIRVLRRLHDVLGLEDRWLDYLLSVDALYELAPDAKRLRDGLMTRLSQRRGRALKSFLVLADQTFAQGGVPQVEPGTPGSTAEDIASAVSRIIALTREEVGLHGPDFVVTDEQALNPFNGTYDVDLHAAHRLEELYRAETMIDGLPYRARVDKDYVVVSSSDPDVEKSVRLGYVQMEMQVHVRQEEMRKFWEQHPQAPLSILEVFKRYYDDVISHFMQVKTLPLPRITFGIPELPNLFDPLADDRMFREDLMFLLQLSVEDYEEFALEPFEVAPGILSIDLFKVNRLFALMAYLYQRELEKVIDATERRRLTLHSVIVPLRREPLLKLLGNVLPLEKAEKILDMLVLDQTRDLVDLQYTPFLKVDDYYLLAPALIAHANLVRNVAFANRLNESRLDGQKDPMQSAVAEALRQAGFHVGEEVEDSARSSTGDTDLVAYRDGVLYLFECKNAYHPCNAHEMRNSYDHIVKAGKQLTLRQLKFGETDYRKKVWKNLGWTMPAPTAIRTAVLIANRVFTGTNIEGHPVRQAHEFINVVARGEIRSPGAVYRFWDGDALSTADLDRYLGTDGLMGDHFASLEPHNYTYDLGSRKLGFKSWKFNALTHQELIQKRYRKLDDTA